MEAQARIAEHASRVREKADFAPTKYAALCAFALGVMGAWLIPGDVWWAHVVVLTVGGGLGWYWGSRERQKLLRREAQILAQLDLVDAHDRATRPKKGR